MAVVQYQLPDTGEVVPLLQIVPSKSGEERTAYWSRACQCARDDHHAAKAAPRGLPAVSRYDPYERVEEVHAEQSRSQGAQSFYHDRQAARGSGDAPSTPSPPALVTAAASCSWAMKPIPAPTNGCRRPYARVNRVGRGMTSCGGPAGRCWLSSIAGSRASGHGFSLRILRFGVCSG